MILLGSLDLLGRRFVIAACFLWMVAPLGLSAQGTDSGASQTESASPATEALIDTIWFDAESESLLPVDVEPREDDSLNRDSRWLPKAERVPASNTASSATGTQANTANNGWFGTGLSSGNLLGWFLIIAFVIVAILIVIYAVSKTEIDLVSSRSSRAAGGPLGSDDQTLERMKQLPPELRRTDVNLQSEAQRLMSIGDYGQAIILLFAHQLLYLDRAGYLRLNRGKTNRRYVRETRSSDRQIADWLQATVTGFERSYFGRHTLEADEFSKLWTDNVNLEQTVQRRQEAAA